MFRHIITEEDKKGYSTFLRAVKLRHHKLVNVLLRAEACAVGECSIYLSHSHLVQIYVYGRKVHVL